MRESRPELLLSTGVKDHGRQPIGTEEFPRQSGRCYICRTIVEVASRELRNDTAGVLRKVESGETVVITRRGKPVADLVPHRSESQRWLSRDEAIDIIENHSADPALRVDLERIAGETTDDLGPIL